MVDGGVASAWLSLGAGVISWSPGPKFGSFVFESFRVTLAQTPQDIFADSRAVQASALERLIREIAQYIEDAETLVGL